MLKRIGSYLLRTTAFIWHDGEGSSSRDMQDMQSRRNNNSCCLCPPIGNQFTLELGHLAQLLPWHMNLQVVLFWNKHVWNNVSKRSPGALVLACSFRRPALLPRLLVGPLDITCLILISKPVLGADQKRGDTRHPACMSPHPGPVVSKNRADVTLIDRHKVR